MTNRKGITTEERIELRESLWRAHEFFGAWRPVGEQLLGMSGAYAWKVAHRHQDPSDEVVYYWREFWVGLRVPWSTNRKLMDAAWEHIKDRWGPENAISVPLLAKLLKTGIRKARATIRALRKEGYPICTTLSRKRPGYFRPRSLAEYREWRKRTQLNRAYDLIDTEGGQKRKEADWFPEEVKGEKEKTHLGVQLPLGGV